MKIRRPWFGSTKAWRNGCPPHHARFCFSQKPRFYIHKKNTARQLHYSASSAARPFDPRQVERPKTKRATSKVCPYPRLETLPPRKRSGAVSPQTRFPITVQEPQKSWDPLGPSHPNRR